MRHLLRHRCYGESIISQSFLPSRAGRNTTLRLNRQEAKTFVLLMGMVLRLSLFLWFSNPAGFRLSCHGHQDLVVLMLDEQAKKGECYTPKLHGYGSAFVLVLVVFKPSRISPELPWPPGPCCSDAR
jgi:hypothetical protein